MDELTRMGAVRYSWSKCVLGLTLFLLLITGTNNQLFAQNRAMNWYFGANAGVNFQSGDAVALSDGQVNTTEGSASISSFSTGDLLFYTDGITVWNRLHEPMPNGNGLLGDESTSQSALILPWPNNNSTYLIVTPAPITSSRINGRCFCLTYSIVDMRREDGYGDVSTKNVMLEDDVTEHLTASPDCEGGGWWIIARKRSTSSFVAYHLTQSGIMPVPVVSVMHNEYEVRDAGQLHSSPSGMHLVMTSASGMSMLYDFERSTGTVYNGVDLFNGVRVGTHYGATFTRDEKYVYTAITTESPNLGTSIYRWDLTAASNSDIILSREQVGWLPDAHVWTPIQLAPDGKIYVGKPGTSFLSRFNTPSGVDAGYQDNAVTLTGSCRSGLPNFPGALLLPQRPGDAMCRVPIARLLDTSLCMNECTRLVDESMGKISLRYWFSPGSVPSTSNEQSPRLCFNKAGVFPVRLIVTNEFGSDTITAYVTVHEKPVLQTSGDASICLGSSKQVSVTGAAIVQWTPIAGLSNPTIQDPIASPTVTTRYMIVGTSQYGCKDTAFIQVNVKSPVAGADQTICTGGSITLNASGADSYLWSPAEGLSDPTRGSPIASPTVTTAYVVRMQVDSCVVFDTVVVTVVDELEVSLNGPNSVCGAETFVLHVIGNARDYTWFGEGIVSMNADSAVVSAPRSGVYVVVGHIDQCQAIDSIFVDVLPVPTLRVPPSITLCNGASEVLTAISDATTITWEPAEGLNTTSGLKVIASPAITTTYTITATNDAGCSLVGTVVVNVVSASTIDAGADKQICKGESIRLSATGSAITYRWEPATGLSDPTVLAPIAQPSITTVYRLTASSGSCVVTDSVTVVVSSIDVSLSKDTSICFGSSVELLAQGASSYRWDPVIGLSDATIPNPIARPHVTTTYEVTGVDVLGCMEKERITVRVIDTSSVRLKVGTVTADAGLFDFGIPVFAEVDPALLPLFVPKLTATLVSDASVFIPTNVDRGTFVTGIRDNTRRTYITLNDILIVTPHQKLTEIRSTILLGKEFIGNLDWEDVEWTGVICPTPETVSGRLYVTGCSLQNRVLKLYRATRIDVITHPQSDEVEVIVAGGEPGTFTTRVFSLDGRVLDEQSASRVLGTETELRLRIDMSVFSSGLYSIIVDSPTERHVNRIAWLP